MDKTKLTIQERFEAFHAAHPEVLEYLLRFAKEFRITGRKRCSMDFLMARVRWFIAIERGEKDTVKLNDHYTSRYARLLTERHPEFQGFFEMRAIRTP